MVAILFEGISDEEVLKSIIKEYDLEINKVIFYDFKGKDNIFNISHEYYDEIQNEVEIGRIEKILIIVDADNPKDPNPNRGYEASKQKLKETISDLEEFGVSIDYYIMCDMNKKGNLESFLLSVLDKEQQDCIKKFRECYKHNLSDKAVYNTFYKQKKEPFDFNHSNFDLLKEKLKNLFI